MVTQQHKYTGENGALYALADLFCIEISAPCVEWDDLAILLAGAFPGVTCHSFE